MVKMVKYLQKGEGSVGAVPVKALELVVNDTRVMKIRVRQITGLHVSGLNPKGEGLLQVIFRIIVIALFVNRIDGIWGGTPALTSPGSEWRGQIIPVIVQHRRGHSDVAVLIVKGLSDIGRVPPPGQGLGKVAE